MTFDFLELAILVSPGAILDPKPVEARGDLAPLLVEIYNPAIELLDLTEEVHIVGRRGPIVLKPDKLWGVQDSGYHKLIVGVWVVSVLEVNHSPELEDAGNDCCS